MADYISLVPLYYGSCLAHRRFQNSDSALTPNGELSHGSVSKMKKAVKSEHKTDKKELEDLNANAKNNTQGLLELYSRVIGKFGKYNVKSIV